MEMIINFLKAVYWWHVHVLRGIFGPTPESGQTWEFAAEPNPDSGTFRVWVHHVDSSRIYYFYEGGRGVVQKKAPFWFRVCFRPSK